VENDAERPAVSVPDAAHAMPEIHPVAALSTDHRPVMHGEHDSVALAQWHDLDPRLATRPLFRQDEFTSAEIPARLV
jgi:hypothetical protein